MFGALRPKPDARMLRRVAARLGVAPSRCILVEDTLVHLKAARSIGMRTRLDAALPRRPLSRRVERPARPRHSRRGGDVPSLSEAALPLCQNRRAPAPDTPSMTPSSDPPAGASGDSEDAAVDAPTPLPDEADRARQRAGRAAGCVATRKRPRPGERRVQILETLATMLQEPGAERVTTAALAAKLDVSEAALYRHFASKAQMFEGLIEFIEQSVFTLVNQIVERETDARTQVQKVLAVLLQFGEKNPGMTRVMVGDALVFENERLTARMNQFFERIESQLRQSLRQLAEGAGSQTPTVDANAQASALTAFAIGRLQRFARSGFKKSPTEHLDVALRLFAA